jgi:trans-AT polyketide synthase/acyltransferase/oxidoreductase domain-containing protein
MKAYLFPGQGSQKKGMGAELFSAYPELVAQADEILGYSIADLCLKDPDNVLGKTDYTQPALYTVNALSWLQAVEQHGKPDFVAGHSLGEYNALFAAGAFDFATGLKLVRERGRLMAQAKAGGMAAVIGADEEKIKHILHKGGCSNISIANYNTPVQTVVSGAAEEIKQAAPHFKEAGITYIPLNVSGAFHTAFMADAAREFETFVKQFSFNDLSIPVISNVTARPYAGKGDVVTLLPRQIISPVCWMESIAYLMLQSGVTFSEVGPGTVLSKMVAAIEKQAAASPPPAFITQLKNTLEQENAAVQEIPEQSVPIKPSFPRLRESSDEPLDSRSRGNDGEGVISATSLGSQAFKQAYGLQYAYVSGAMVHGIASTDVVIAMGKAGMMGFFGTGGLSLQAIEQGMITIKEALGDKPYGMNLLHTPDSPEKEEAQVDLYLRHGVNSIEASAFMQITPALVKYRLAGLYKNADGSIASRHKIMAKLSRPEVATAFLSPAPERLLKRLLEAGKINVEQAELAAKLPMADAICVEADSGGHTDQGVAYALMPAMLNLRAQMKTQHGYPQSVFIGAAGGIGTPEAAAAAFILGADFVLTGSINQCTVEAGTSDLVKDMLAQINVQDTDYAPAGDMFELGAKVQVLRKGVFFPARANKLYELYKQYKSLDDVDSKTREQLEKQYFKKSLAEIYQETKTYWQQRGEPAQIDKAEKNPKHKMALIFKWYFGYSNQAALKGAEADKVNFQVHTGPALGAFNQWVKGSELEDWRKRHVADIGIKLLTETAALLNERFAALTGVTKSLNHYH